MKVYGNTNIFLSVDLCQFEKGLFDFSSIASKLIVTVISCKSTRQQSIIITSVNRKDEKHKKTLLNLFLMFTGFVLK